MAWPSVFLREQENAGCFKPMVGYSDGLTDLISQMLHPEPMKRPTAEDILGSPFVRETVTKLREQIIDEEDRT